MSYEPMLIIKKADLVKHSDKIEEYYREEPNKRRVLEYLHDILSKQDSVKIDNIELIICRPEFTSFNKLVRAKLNEFKVQYAEAN